MENSTLNRYSLDRKAASKLLKVSIRTVDRYVKQKKVSNRVVSGRIWLDRAEIEGLRQRRYVDMSTPEMSIDTAVDNMDEGVDSDVDNIDIIDQDYIQNVQTKTRKRSSENKLYKNLYEDLKEEVKEKQERLEIANYRVGQLETQVKNSIPLLEYHRESYANKQREEKIQTRLKSHEKLFKNLASKLKSEKFNKRVFLIVLLITLALQPLWLLLIYR